MKQTLIILRGAPGSGKTTLGGKLRDTEKKVAWVSVDGVKPIFSNYDDRDVSISYKTTIVLVEFLLNEGYCVVYDGIYANRNPGDYLDQAIELAKNKNIPVVIYQLITSLETALARHKKRDWVKAGNLQSEQENVKRLHEKVKNSPVQGAVELNTEENSLEECLAVIRKNFE